VRTLRVPACVRVRVPRVLGSDDVSENSGHTVRVGVDDDLVDQPSSVTSPHPEHTGVHGVKEIISDSSQATRDLRVEIVHISAEEDIVSCTGGRPARTWDSIS
jgi:hypothetical protein